MVRVLLFQNCSSSISEQGVNYFICNKIHIAANIASFNFPFVCEIFLLIKYLSLYHSVYTSVIHRLVHLCVHILSNYLSC
jgi:hypothetical protein